jgi:cyclopropane fatty-acyl-phospholipid synthase-like methyltransferase
MLYHDLRGAFRYGLRKTFAPVALKYLTIEGADITMSSPYEAVNYYMLEKLLKTFHSLSPENSIIDLGCGKGRVMVVAAHFGFKKLVGIDFAKELCIEASRNMERTQFAIKDIDWKVIHANVLDYPIRPDDAVFFMFNPFVEETLSLFLDKLERSCKQNPRKTWFLYASPQHAIALENRGYQMAYWKKLMNLEGKILCKD